MADVSEMLAEQIEYRELLYQMTARDLLLRYKQSGHGIRLGGVHAAGQHGRCSR